MSPIRPIVAACALVAATLGVAQAAGAPAARTGATAKHAGATQKTNATQKKKPWGTNLVTNSGGEAGMASDAVHVVKPAGWQTDGAFTVLRFGSAINVPPRSSAVPLGTPSPPPPLPEFFGQNVFAGGPAGRVKASAWQNISLDWAATEIDAGRAKFELSGWLAGFHAHQDSAVIAVNFYKKNNVRACGDATRPCFAVGPVTRTVRADATKFFEQACWGTVPRGVRSAEMRIESYGATGPYNEGYADNIGFTLADPHRAPQRLDHCAAGLQDSEVLRRMSVATPYDRRCATEDFAILGICLAFWLGSLTAIAMGRLPRIRTWRRGFSLLVVAGAAIVGFALPFAVLGRVTTSFQPTDLGCPTQVPGGLLTLAFLIVSAFIAFLVGGLVLHRKALVEDHRKAQAEDHRKALVEVPRKALAEDHPKPLLAKQTKRIVLLADFAITGALVGVVVLLTTAQTEDNLKALTASLLVCAVIMVYARLAFAQPTLQRIPLAVRVGLFLLFLVPAIQPLETIRKFDEIRTERLAFEQDHGSFEIVSPSDRYDNILLEAPTRLDYSESAHVTFFARHSAAARQNDCVTPRIVAPGFDVTSVAAEPAQRASEVVRWEWLLTPKQSGRQYVAVTAFYSKECKKYTDSVTSTARFEPVFTAEDSIWVSRKFFASENLSGLSSSLTAVVGIVTVAFGIFGAKLGGGTGKSDGDPDGNTQNRNNDEPEKEKPAKPEPGTQEGDIGNADDTTDAT